MILAGDIGGTHTRLALFEDEDNRVATLRETTLSSRKYAGLADAVQFFLRDEKRPIRAACFGIAGPVFAQSCTATNLPWRVDAAQFSKTLHIPSVKLINDLEAMALGTLSLDANDLVVLNAGTPDPRGKRAVIAAGTGLGEGLLFWDGAHYRPSASEGGHCDFAPRNRTEIALLEFLIARYGRVSYERILSGPGLLNIYQFLKEKEEDKEAPWLTEAFKVKDPGSVITDAALNGTSELCVKALNLFVSIYGAEAGNLGLKLLATGGVYIGGGIAPQIVKKLQDGAFIETFRDKGRYGELMDRIPIHIILNDRCALLGAARYCQ